MNDESPLGNNRTRIEVRPDGTIAKIEDRPGFSVHTEEYRSGKAVGAEIPRDEWMQIPTSPSQRDLAKIKAEYKLRRQGDR